LSTQTPTWPAASSLPDAPIHEPSGGDLRAERSAGLARDLRLVGWQVLYEQRAFWRNRRRSIFSIAFPLMFLLIFGLLDRKAHIKSLGGISYITFFVPGIIAYTVMVVGFTNMAMSIALLRSEGILKRLRATPMPTSAYLAGVTLSTVLTILIATAILLLVGAGLLGATIRISTLPALIVTLLVGTAAFTSLGISVSRLIPKPDSGSPILMFITLPLAFFSNVFFPLGHNVKWLETIAKILPLQPLADALQAAFHPHTSGAGFVGKDLLTLAIWTALGCWLMVKTMRVLSAKD
jgi:ABC-2 type transport system permease protein